MFNKKLKEQVNQQRALIDMQWEHIKNLHEEIDELKKTVDNLSEVLTLEVIRVNDRADYLEILNRQFSEES